VSYAPVFICPYHTT